MVARSLAWVLPVVSILAGGPEMASAAAPQTEVSVETLSLEDLNRTLESVWSRPAPPPDSDPLTSRRNALEQALTQLGPGTSILPASTASGTEEPLDRFFQEWLPGKIGYIRLGKTLPQRSAQLQAALQDLHQLGARALVLDLRASNAGGTLLQAGELASCFVPKDTPLFAIQPLTSQKPPAPVISSKNPPASFPLVLLVNANTRGCAEVLAALLRIHADAFLIGQHTAGMAADYEETPLSQGRVFRFPVAKAVLEKAPQLFPKGLHPDLSLSIPLETTEAVLQKALQDGKVDPLIRTIERPRLNEAALVANRNPETENWIRETLARQQGAVEPNPVLQDAALLRALDFVETRNALQSAPKGVGK
jgi:hypothetical protein